MESDRPAGSPESPDDINHRIVRLMNAAGTRQRLAAGAELDRYVRAMERVETAQGKLRAAESALAQSAREYEIALGREAPAPGSHCVRCGTGYESPSKPGCECAGDPPADQGSPDYQAYLDRVRQLRYDRAAG